MVYTVSLSYELELARRGGYYFIAGLDEAGRGAWAGPIVAGAVVLPIDRLDLMHALTGVKDSKLLSPYRREKLLPVIELVALSYGVGSATHTEIDSMGVVEATRLAMGRAIEALDGQPDALLTDALTLPDLELPCTPLIKGDQKSLSIAAASILAKVTRDRFMCKMDLLYPQYGFRAHKGYGTVRHHAALREFGVTPIHRRSFEPVRMVYMSMPEGPWR